MEIACPRCGSKNIKEKAGAAEGDFECAECGASLGVGPRAVAHVRPSPSYDGYEIGRRVLKIAPGWIVLCVAAFVLALIFFSWLSRPAGKTGASSEGVFKNEAMNQTNPAPRAQEARTATAVTKQTPAPVGVGAGREESSGREAATDAREADVAGETYSVQVGAFDDRSQANEQVSRLRAAGFEARVVESDANTRFRYQVRSGSLETRNEAAHLAAQLRAKRLADETVIIEPVSK
jgi:cell division septation protein DedD